MAPLQPPVKTPMSWPSSPIPRLAVWGRKQQVEAGLCVGGLDLVIYLGWKALRAGPGLQVCLSLSRRSHVTRGPCHILLCGTSLSQGHSCLECLNFALKLGDVRVVGVPSHLSPPCPSPALPRRWLGDSHPGSCQTSMAAFHRTGWATGHEQTMAFVVQGQATTSLQQTGLPAWVPPGVNPFPSTGCLVVPGRDIPKLLPP